MPTIYLERHINAAIAEVWKQVSDIRSPERLTNMIHSVEVIGEGERSCVTEHGRIVERIVSVDEDRRRWPTPPPSHRSRSATTTPP